MGAVLVNTVVGPCVLISTYICLLAMSALYKLRVVLLVLCHNWRGQRTVVVCFLLFFRSLFLAPRLPMFFYV